MKCYAPSRAAGARRRCSLQAPRPRGGAQIGRHNNPTRLWKAGGGAHHSKACGSSTLSVDHIDCGALTSQSRAGRCGLSTALLGPHRDGAPLPDHRRLRHSGTPLQQLNTADRQAHLHPQRADAGQAGGQAAHGAVQGARSRTAASFAPRALNCSMSSLPACFCPCVGPLRMEMWACRSRRC